MYIANLHRCEEQINHSLLPHSHSFLINHLFYRIDKFLHFTI